MAISIDFSRPPQLAQRYDVRTYGTDSKCIKPAVTTIFRSGECTAVNVCTGGNITECAVADYRQPVRNAFGPTPYVLIERFSDTHTCRVFSSAAAVPLDVGCYGLVAGKTFFTAQLAPDRTLTIRQFSGFDCQSTTPEVFTATAEQREQFPCIQGRLLTVMDGKETGVAHAGGNPGAPPVPTSASSFKTATPQAAPSVSTDMPSSSRGSESVATQEQANSGSSKTLIVGFVLGTVIVLVVAFVLIRRRRRKRETDSTTELTSKLVDSANTDPSRDLPLAPNMVLRDHEDAFFARDHDLKIYRRPAEEIRDECVVGAGAFCIVWRVRIRGSIAVASKRLKTDNPSQDQIVQFIEEIKLSAKLTHPRVVEFIGVAWTNDKDLQALFEYMENGTLRSWLRKHRNSEITSWSEDKLQIAIDVAEALAYTHSFVPPLIHRDLKSSNVLLTISLRAKLSDFGIARFKSYENTMTAGAGTTLWLSPEVIAGRRDYDQRTDVFSFGVLLSELDTHELPYFDVRDESGERMLDIMVAKKIVDDHLTPTFLPSCPRPVLELARRCLSFNPRERPAAAEILFRLDQVKQGDF